MDYIKRIRALVGHERLIMVGAGVMLYKDGKVLLQKRKDNGCWADHGGGLEIGETIEQAAKRELFEETGITARSLRFMALFTGEDTMYTYPNGDEVYIVMTYWICEDFEGTPHADPDEVTELRWFELDKLPEKISPPSRRPIKTFVEMAHQKEKQGTWPAWTGESYV